MELIQSAGLLSLLRRLWGHLSRRRRRQFVGVLGLMLISALAEVVSLGALLPFLGALSSPERVFGHPTVAALAERVGITSADQILLPLTIVFVITAVAAAGIRLLLLWTSTRLSFAAGADLGIEVYRRTLYQPYRVHIARNSSDVIAGITGKVAGLVYGGLLPVISLLSSAVLIVAVMSALLAINAFVAAVAALVVGASYGVITKWARRGLEENGQRIAREQTLVLKALQEGLGGIRDVLLDGTQEFYCRVYVEADRPLRRAQGDNQFIASAPRFVIEAVAMAIIATIAYGLTQGQNGLTSALPVLGALALGAQKLLQAVQMAYAAWAGLAGSRASLADAIDLLDQPMPAVGPGQAVQPLPCRDGIRFSQVDFRYTPDGPWILKDFDLAIPRGSRLGIVGATGSGKSTVLDLLMGLLAPERGEIVVDDVPLTRQNLAAWQRQIAHVPQQIYLADSSIAENIAFGVPPESIDLVRVRSAAQQAHIAEFIESSSAGYNARVGERGIRLSGGQRQRIGIARALYKQANVLIFDEATSALDSVTETAVMEAIEELNREMTIILIAHRLTTVRRCDTIVELDRGRVVATGPYDFLLETSASFRKLAAAAP
jgi:ABC-type multidrug transport system fused ATPase/permease subunit